jgi:formylglycine-generating enzyme required for sulfatase activity/predicted Ser/Thr protein kinase
MGFGASSVVGRRYEVIETLGAGRRGVVYLARDRLTDAKLAVKRLRTDSELQASAEMTLRAAEIQASIRHDGIVRVFDVGEDGIGPYVVSEFIDGPDLARLVATQGAMDLARAIATTGLIGEGLIAAASRGLFHGSVRGSNVLLAPDGKVKVADFSVAGLTEADEARARRQDVRGLARTLCQLLTGVSQGTIDVSELPRSVRSVIRHAMGRQVASRQATIELFLRELRASELEADPSEFGEAAAIRRGRQAELSGSYAAMREAGEAVQQANAESAEAMVLLRRADLLEQEKHELVRTLSDREVSFDYAGALETLSRLQRRFPADHQVIRLVGQKRQTLAELTRLRGLGDQLVAAGRVADAYGPWRRVLELRPDDPAAREHAKLGRRARLRRRLISASAAVLVLSGLGGGAWAAWRFGGVGMIPGLSGPATEEASATPSPGQGNERGPAPDSVRAPVNPLVRGPAAAEDGPAADAGVASSEDGGAGDGAEVASGAESGSAPGAPLAESPAEAEAGRALLAREAEQAERDAMSARGHALSAGAPGLASEEFESAQRRYERGVSLLGSGSLEEASEVLASARGGFVTAAASARSRIASIEGLIGERRLRAASSAIAELEGSAPGGTIDDLRTALAAARSRVVEVAGVAVELRYVEPGVFEMGSAADEPGRRATEDRRSVRIERPFWIMRTELTAGQLAAARGEAASVSADLPATGLSLDGALEVAGLLSDAGPGTFSVPSEAQWEYAARADSSDLRGGRPIDEAAWWLGNAGASLRPVGALAENAWGLVDVLGNAAELVIAPELGHGEQVAMTRGGSYLSPESAVRAAARHELVPRDRGDPRTGVRLIWMPDGDEPR